MELVSFAGVMAQWSLADVPSRRSGRVANGKWETAAVILRGQELKSRALQLRAAHL